MGALKVQSLLHTLLLSAQIAAKTRGSSEIRNLRARFARSNIAVILPGANLRNLGTAGQRPEATRVDKLAVAVGLDPAQRFGSS